MRCGLQPHAMPSPNPSPSPSPSPHPSPHPHPNPNPNKVADDVYEMLQWRMDGAPKPLRWHAQQQASYAYYLLWRALLTMARTTYYGAHYLRWRALLTMARTTYDGAHYLLWRALLTMAGELHSLRHGSSTHYGRGAELQAAVLTILTMAGCGRDGGLARLVVQDPGARAAARLDRGRG